MKCNVNFSTESLEVIWVDVIIRNPVGPPVFLHSVGLIILHEPEANVMLFLRKKKCISHKVERHCQRPCGWKKNALK